MSKGSYPTTPFAVLCSISLAVAVTVTQARHQPETNTCTLSFEEWIVNAPGPYEPHDPAVDATGKAWFTGYSSNTVGFVDPTTDEVGEFPLPTPNTGPHGLTADMQGAIWFTGNRAGLVGRIDPETGGVTEYRMPDPAARDPHTPVFDQQGKLWFTLPSSNFIGRLDPETGAVALAAVATPKSNPHGIEVNSKGVPFFTLAATNRLGSIHPQTMKISEYVLPEGARPRRLGIAADDTVWYADHGRGFLSRFDPATGGVEDFPTPGGATAAPWSVAVTTDGVVWYTESGLDPNTLVRFDPRSKTMQAWPLPSSGGVVRHMVATQDGALWLASSGNKRMIRAQVSGGNGCR